MTREEREEAIKYFKRQIHLYWVKGQCRKAGDLAIEALEQAPCEDCISRQAVDTLVDELARAISDERCCISRGRSTAIIMQDILDLPSVTPQPKIGRWAILKDEYGDIVEAVCLNCHMNGRHEWAFCPNCGRKMQEVKE